MAHEAELEPEVAPRAPEPPAPAPAPVMAPPVTDVLFGGGLGAGLGAPAPSFASHLARRPAGERKSVVDDLNGRVGNRRVTRMLRAGAPIVARTGAVAPAGNVIPDAAGALAAVHPRLAAVVPETERETVSRYLATFLSSGEDYDRPKPILDDVPGPRAIALKPADLLRGDILGLEEAAAGGEFVPPNPRERNFRSALYSRLLASAFTLHLGARKPRSGPPRLEAVVSFGPHRWPVELGEDGRVGWRELLRVEALNFEYQQAVGEAMARNLAEQEALVEAAGGAVVDLSGKKIGELRHRGRFWEPDLKIRSEVGDLSGYKDDARGRARAAALMYGSSRGRALIRAPDGYLHVFELDRPLDPLTDFGSSDDGYARILGEESQLEAGFEVRVIVGKGGTEFTPQRGGWAAPADPNAVGVGESLLFGAIIGDAWEDPTAEAVFAQIVVGVIPGVGMAADARDVLVGIEKMWATGGKEGKLQTALAAIGFLPVLGDGIKIAARAGRRAVLQAVKELTPVARRAWAEIIKESPGLVASRLKLATELAGKVGDVESLVAKALSKNAGADDVKKAIDGVEIMLAASGGNAGAVVQKATRSGKWKELAQLLAKAPERADLAKQLNDWRKAELDAFKKHLPTLQADAARDAARPVSPPEFQQTGTVKDMTNDVDISFLGPDAGRYAQLSKTYLEARYGMPYEKVKDMLDAEVFTDPTRFLLHQQLPPDAAKRVAGQLTTEAELNTLVKMLKQGTDPDRVKAMAKALGVSMDAVSKRKDELVQFADKTFRAQKELEIDNLHRQFAAAKDPAAKESLAREIAELQGKLNAADKEAYTTAGGVATNVVIRDDVADARKWVDLDPQLRYQSVLDDMVTLETTLHKIELEGITKDTVKPLAKYADRLLTRAGQLGGLTHVDPKKARAARELYDQVTEMLAAARANPGLAATHQRMSRVYAQAAEQLSAQIREIVAAAKAAGSKPGKAAAPLPEELAAMSAQAEMLLRLASRAVTVPLRAEARRPDEEAGGERSAPPADQSGAASR